jgi:DNA repair exonuclease SbcCD ATPase subunit
MKTKITEALKTKYSNLGFDASVITAVADFLGKSVTTEEQIETGVAGVEGLLKVYQSNFDKARGEKGAKEKEIEELKAKIEELQKMGTPAAPKPEEIEAKLNALIEQKVKSVQDELNTYKANEAAAKRNGFISAEAEALGIPKEIFSKLSIDHELDDAGIKSELAAIKQVFVNNTVETGKRVPVYGKTEFTIEDGREALKTMRL